MHTCTPKIPPRAHIKRSMQSSPRRAPCSGPSPPARLVPKLPDTAWNSPSLPTCAAVTSAKTGRNKLKKKLHFFVCTFSRAHCSAPILRPPEPSQGHACLRHSRQTDVRKAILALPPPRDVFATPPPFLFCSLSSFPLFYSLFIFPCLAFSNSRLAPASCARSSSMVWTWVAATAAAASASSSSLSRSSWKARSASSSCSSASFAAVVRASCVGVATVCVFLLLRRRKATCCFLRRSYVSTLGESHAALNTDRDRSKDGLLLFQGTRKLFRMHACCSERALFGSCHTAEGRRELTRMCCKARSSGTDNGHEQLRNF